VLQVNLSAVPIGCSAASLYIAVKGDVGPADVRTPTPRR
jgi:hypothetical protein